MSYEQAREAFDAVIRDNDPPGAWSKLQARLYVWQDHVYGTPQPVRMALGVVEELGELAEAVSGEDIDDAVADVTIYATQLATCFRLDIGVIAHEAVKSVTAQEQKTVVRQPKHGAMKQAGRLCHVVLKNNQGIRGMGDRETARKAVYEALVPVIEICVWHTPYCDDAEYLKNVTETAERVMARKKAELPMVVR